MESEAFNRLGYKSNIKAGKVKTKNECIGLWLINFGLGNKHKLPHQKIINELVNNGKVEEVFSNTQIKGFEYCFKYS